MPDTHSRSAEHTFPVSRLLGTVVDGGLVGTAGKSIADGAVGNRLGAPVGWGVSVVFCAETSL